MNQIPPPRVRLAAALALLALAGLGPRPVAAQAEARLTAGLSVFTLQASGSTQAEFSPIGRLNAAVGLALPLRGSLFVRPELHYSTRGARIDGPLYDGSVELDAISEITVIEIPVLLGFAIPVRGAVEPRLFAGPVLSRRMDAVIRYRARAGGPWFSETDASVERTEVGMGFGGEVVFPVGGQRLVTGVRGLVGISRAIEPDPERENPPTLHHRGLLVYAGVVF